MAQNWLDKDVDTTTPEQVLHDTFRHATFRDGQRDMIDAAVKGRDVLGIAPTGLGKSLCYELPALMEERGKATIIASPLLALMREQSKAMRDLGIPAFDMNSQSDEAEKPLERLSRGEVAMLFTSPEQLDKHATAQSIKAARPARLVVDESHCISEWGHDFRPAFRRLSVLRDGGVSNVSAFTATASKMVSRDIRQCLRMDDCFEYRGSALRDNLGYNVEKINSPAGKRKRALELVTQFAPERTDCAIVYCSTKKEVTDTQAFFMKNGVPAFAYHGDCDAEQRRAMETMFKDDKIRVMVATNAFGMGVDKPNVRIIIHLNIPGSVPRYVQETGRAGRDGGDAQCVLLYSEKDLAVQETFINDKAPDIGFIQTVFNAVRRQKEKSKQSVGDYFPLNKIGLYKSFEFTKPNGLTGNRNTEVNAALAILEHAGVIKKFDNYISISSFEPGDNAYRAAEAESGARKDIAQMMLQQMIRYASHDRPDQKLLLELMDEEVTIDEKETATQE